MCSPAARPPLHRHPGVFLQPPAARGVGLELALTLLIIYPRPGNAIFGCAPPGADVRSSDPVQPAAGHDELRKLVVGACGSPRPSAATMNTRCPGDAGCRTTGVRHQAVHRRGRRAVFDTGSGRRWRRWRVAGGGGHRRCGMGHPCYPAAMKFTLLTHFKEFDKRSNTGRLVLEILERRPSGCSGTAWNSPARAGGGDQYGGVTLVYPSGTTTAGTATTCRASALHPKSTAPGIRPARYHHAAPTCAWPAGSASRRQGCRSTRPAQPEGSLLCTAECVIEMPAGIGMTSMPNSLGSASWLPRPPGAMRGAAIGFLKQHSLLWRRSVQEDALVSVTVVGGLAFCVITMVPCHAKPSAVHPVCFCLFCWPSPACVHDAGPSLGQARGLIQRGV